MQERNKKGHSAKNFGRSVKKILLILNKTLALIRTYQVKPNMKDTDHS